MSRVVAAGPLLVLAVGCGFSAASDPPIDAPAGVDAPPDGGPASLRWGAPVQVAITGSFFAIDDPSLTADGRELFFGAIRNGDVDESLYLARRATVDDDWGDPTEIGPLGSDDTLESNVDVLPDGLLLTYSRDINSGSGTDLFYAARDARELDFNSPSRFTTLSSGQGEYGMWLDPTQLTAILCSNRPDRVDEALWTSTRPAAGQGFPAPQPIAELDSPADECDAHLPDPLTLYFTRNVAAGSVDLDLYVTHRARIDAPWDSPTRIDELSQLGTRDSDPWVSADQSVIYFSSNRSGADRLYMSRREPREP